MTSKMDSSNILLDGRVLWSSVCSSVVSFGSNTATSRHFKQTFGVCLCVRMLSVSRVCTHSLMHVRVC